MGCGGSKETETVPQAQELQSIPRGQSRSGTSRRAPPPSHGGVKAVLVEPAVPHLMLVVPHLKVKPDVLRLTVKLSVHSLNVSLVRGRHQAVVDIHLDLLTKGLALTLSQKSQKIAQFGRKYQHCLR